MDTQQLRQLKPKLRKFLSQFDDCFLRKDTRSHLPTYVEGQLSSLQDKSVEPIALKAGVAPRTLQEFLSQLKWDQDKLRDRLQDIVRTEHAGRHAIGIFDETSYVKKGDKTPGVKRQWCGAVGKEENCMVTVHLGYACGEFHCLLDGELFLPEDWSADRQRCREAGIPEAISYRPKWQIALELLDRAVGRGIHVEWLTFDEGYGGKPGFLRGLARAISSSSARSPAISPVGSRLPAWSHDRSIARDVGAGVRFRGWLPTVPTLDVSTRCSTGTNSGTNPGDVGGSRMGRKGR